MSDGASKAPLVVAIDFRQPQSYLAKGPTMKLATALGVAVDWQPIEVRPFEEPPAIIEGDDRGARHRRFRAHYFERDLARYAEAQGLVLRRLHRAPDASVAGKGLLWVKKHAGRSGTSAMVDHYVDAVFDGYWGETLELDDPAAIRDVLAGVGAPISSFDPAALDHEYEGVLARWRAAGVFGAPTYIVGDDLFIGRAHLPMIEWIWNGRVGPPPI